MRRAEPSDKQWWVPTLVCAFVCVLVIEQFRPIFSMLDVAIFGDAETDAIKGMWSFDHVRRSMLPPETPIWSTQAHFPDGVLALVLPWVSAVLLSPLGMLAGPVVGWNLSVVMMFVAAGVSTAWCVRVLTESWGAAVVAGAAMIGQPMLLHAVGDGTPEHASIWLIPVFLGCLTKAARSARLRWALAAGVAATLVALDSPYNAVYSGVLVVFCLPLLLASAGTLRWWRPRLRALAVFAVTVTIGAGAFWLIYRNFPLEQSVRGVQLTSSADPLCQQEVGRYLKRGSVCLDLYHSPDEFSDSCRDHVRRFCSMNTTDLRTWWQFAQMNDDARQASLAPTLVPTGVLVSMVLLGVFGAPHALPLLVAGVVMLALALDLNPINPERLEAWLGQPGRQLGDAILALNGMLTGLPGLRSIRFPQRWLVPGALSLLLAGAFGLARLERWVGLLVRKLLDARAPSLRARVPASLWTVGGLLPFVVVAGLAHQEGVAASKIGRGFPVQVLPKVAFAEWVRDREGPGAFVLLPDVRPVPKTEQGPMRAELPVFANLDDALSGSDKSYLQVLMQRPSLHAPALKTLRKMRLAEARSQMIRNWDDMSLAVLNGTEIPSNLYHERSVADRHGLITELRQAGLRFVIVDRGAFYGDALMHLERDLEPHVLHREEFDEGDGVIVFELARH